MRKMILAGVAFASLLATTGCFEVPHETATATLASQGYTDIKLGGYDAFGCGEDDGAATRFTARGANRGYLVKGILCSGVGWGAKGITVRIIDTVWAPAQSTSFEAPTQAGQ